MPNLYALNTQFRAELIAGEERAADALVSRYGIAWRTIKDNLDQLLAQIEQERAAGKTVSGAWLRRQERYERLLADAEREVGEFARYASQAAQQQQQAAVAAGLNAAPQLAAASTNTPFVLVNWNRLPTEAFRDLVGFTADGTPLSKLLGSLGPRAARSIQGELLSGLAQGKGIRHVARQIEGELGGDLVRARLIARTETLRAYRESSIRSYGANPRVCKKWRWTASRSRRTCGMCLAMDGREFPLDVPFGSHPQCFPAGAVVTGPPVVGTATRWFEGEVVEIDTALGNRLTVTPNHPILTDNGWIAAGLLNVGSYVISSRNAERALASVYPDDYQVPALIENVAEAFGSAGGVSSARVPTTTEDFHGDGGGSEVCVIRTNRLLRNAFNPSLGEPFAHQEFRGRGVRHRALPAEGALALLLEGANPASDSSVGGFDVSPVLFGGSLCHHHAVSFGLGASGRVGGVKNQSDPSSSDVERFSEGVFAFASDVASGDFGFRDRGQSAVMGARFRSFDSVNRGFISPQSAGFEGFSEPDISDPKSASSVLATLAGSVSQDRVLKVNRRAFRGHVYNLQTSAGWYIANGIITHNCRCTATPVTVSAAEMLDDPTLPDLRPKRDKGEEWFAKQQPDLQLAVLGKTKFKMYQDGELQLSELVGYRNDADWGPTRWERSLKSLRGE